MRTPLAMKRRSSRQATPRFGSKTCQLQMMSASRRTRRRWKMKGKMSNKLLLSTMVQMVVEKLRMRRVLTKPVMRKISKETSKKSSKLMHLTRQSRLTNSSKMTRLQARFQRQAKSPQMCTLRRSTTKESISMHRKIIKVSIR